MDALYRWTLALAAAVSVAFTAPAGAQGVFPAPETFPDLRLEVAGTVNAVVKYNDGLADHYLIGGDFDLVNGESRRNLARLDANGNLDAAWSADTDGVVTALALGGDQLFVGGTFTVVDGQSRLRLAKLDADDAQLAAWAPDANGAVNALQTDGTTVWAGGAFTSIEGSARNHVAAIDGGAGTVGAFNAGLGGGAVYALLLDGSELYIGGQGRLRGSQRGLVKVDAVTGAQIAWNPGIAAKGGSRVRALAADGTSVYAVGIIRRIGNSNWGNGARWSKSSPATLQAWNPNSDAEILAIALDGGFAFVGGDFLNLGGHARLARTDATSGAASVGWDADADRRVATLLVDGAQLIAGGGFAEIDGTGAQGGLSRLATADAAIDATFMGDAAGPGTVSAFAIDADGGVILGGSFDAARQDGEAMLYPRRNVVRLLPAGGAEAQYELDKTWGVTAAGEVFGVAIAGTDLYLGGNFAQVNGSARTRLAKLAAATGVLDALWLPTADAPVRHLVADAANARVYLAGDFISVSATARDGLARVAAGGAGALEAWNPQPDDSVDALLVSGSNVYLGGRFTTLNNGTAARVGLARVDDAAGTADPGFVADVSALGEVQALAEGAAGIYAGGQFTTLAGAARNGIGRVAADGTVDATWNPDVATGTVDAIALDEANGLAYFGGTFAMAGDDAHSNLARASLAGAGAVDPSWRPGTDGNVVQMAVPQAGQVLFAGAFVNVTGVMRNGVALLGTAGSDATQIAITSVTPVGGVAGANSVFGQGYVVAWSVTDTTTPGNDPTGSVTVTASSGESCSASEAAGSCQLAATGTGARTLVAAFTGDPLFLDAVSAPAPHTVDAAQATLTVATTPNPSGLVDPVTANITLVVTAPGGGAPQGDVVLTVNGGPGCTIALPATSCALALGGYGYYTVAATYTDAVAPARHVAAPASTIHAVGTPTTMTLSVPATATIGTAVTASVATTGIPDGEQVAVSGGLGCTITIAANAGSCQLTFDAAGSIAVTAAYAGNNEFLPVQDGDSVTVSLIATSIELSALPAAPSIGQSVTLSAATTGMADGAVLAVANAPGCASITITANAGSCATSFAAAGAVTVQASFAQTAQRAASSDDLQINVGKIATSFALGLAPANPVVGQGVVVSLVTPQLPADAIVAITGGSGCVIDRSVGDSCNLAFAAAGVTPVMGQFAETATHLASSASTDATVGKAATAFSAFAPSAFTAQPGDTITFTWAVAAQAPGQGTPTGSVRVSVNGDGTPPSCTAAVAAGTCGIVFPAEGTFAMRADYLGDANFNVSFSTTANITIASAAPAEADLQIAKIVSRSRLDPANQIEQVEYQIVVANAGPAAVDGAAISDVLPSSLSAAVWTCVADDAGANCDIAGGTGNVSLTADLAVGSSVTITLQADVDDAPFPGVQNTATVAVPVDQTDPVPANNSDTVLYQACRANTGATLTLHSCTFRDGFEAPPL